MISSEKLPESENPVPLVSRDCVALEDVRPEREPLSDKPRLQQSLMDRLLQRAGGGRTPAALFDQGLVSGANFVTNVLLARALGIKEYGVFALAWTAVMFANSLQYALIVTPMMSVGPKQEPEERPSYYGSVLLQEITFALLAALTMFASVQLSTVYFPQWE